MVSWSASFMLKLLSAKALFLKVSTKRNLLWGSPSIRHLISNKVPWIWVQMVRTPLTWYSLVSQSREKLGWSLVPHVCRSYEFWWAAMENSEAYKRQLHVIESVIYRYFRPHRHHLSWGNSTCKVDKCHLRTIYTLPRQCFPNRKSHSRLILILLTNGNTVVIALGASGSKGMLQFHL